MNKLYPPIIEGKLPAQAGNTFEIPFSLNKTININSIVGVGLIIKTVSQGQLIISNLRGTFYKKTEENIYYAQFNVSDLVGKKINPGQFYKVQICFISNDEKNGNIYGYYSTFGVLKYTTVPKVSLPDFESNYFKDRNIIGVYENEDYTEKVYSYEFFLRDQYGNLIESSGEQFHDASTDVEKGKSIDSWIIKKELSENEAYYLTYKITTNNNLIAFSNSYKVMQGESIDISFPCKLIAYQEDETASVKLYLRPKNYPETSVINGDYVLSRANLKSNEIFWEDIFRFSFNSFEFFSDILLWEDFTCEFNEEYLYSLQSYNEFGLYTNRLTTEKVKLNFEDMYLFDGDRQLSVKFNPKVTSFKTNILETKTNTIGSKYPFIFRNGIVNYKEFQISGLISYLTDLSGKFLQGTQLDQILSHRLSTPSNKNNFSNSYFNLTDENIYSEKIFRDEVFNWLTDGKPKLFRSPTEGNFLVQLMNITMTPIDTLGRLLYSFNCTACEIDNCNFKTLEKYNFNKNAYTQTNRYHLSIKQINVKDFSSKLLPEEAFNIKIGNALEGDQLLLYFSDGDKQLIQIGPSGVYNLNLSNKKLIQIDLVNSISEKTDIKLIYCHYTTVINSFNGVKNITLKDKISQHIGKTLIEDNFNGNNPENFFKENEFISKIYYLEAYQRPIVEIYKENETQETPAKYYLGKKDDVFYFPLYLEELKQYFSEDVILKIVNQVPIRYLDGRNFEEIYYETNELDDEISSDFFNITIIQEDEDKKETSISYNLKNDISLEGFTELYNPDIELKANNKKLILKNISNVKSIKIGNGVILNLCYQLKTKILASEEDNL